MRYLAWVAVECSCLVGEAGARGGCMRCPGWRPCGPCERTGFGLERGGPRWSDRGWGVLLKRSDQNQRANAAMSDSSETESDSSESSSGTDVDHSTASTSSNDWTVALSTQRDLRTTVNWRSAPFDSGHWTVNWVTATRYLSLEWTEVNRPARIYSLKGDVLRPSGRKHNITGWTVAPGIFPLSATGRLGTCLHFLGNDPTASLRLELVPASYDDHVLVRATSLGGVESRQAAGKHRSFPSLTDHLTTGVDSHDACRRRSCPITGRVHPQRCRLLFSAQQARALGKFAHAQAGITLPQDSARLGLWRK